MQRAQKSEPIESKITITLLISGDPVTVESAKEQIEHYASALPGVRLDK